MIVEEILYFSPIGNFASCGISMIYWLLDILIEFYRMTW